LIDKSKPIPLYYQVKESLLKKIKNGQFRVGDPVPSETELQDSYQVSRITVRRAVQELVAEGYLYTQQGKGTFVSKPKAAQELNTISSWAETMTELGMHPRSKIIHLSEEVAPENVAKMLELNDEEKIFRLERIRYADNEPICLMTNYLTPALVPGFLSKGLKEESLYGMLERNYHIVFGRAEEIVEARAAKSNEAALLNIKRGAPLLCATRVTRDSNDRPLEVSMTISRADRYSYRIKLQGREQRK